MVRKFGPGFQIDLQVNNTRIFIPSLLSLVIRLQDRQLSFKKLYELPPAPPHQLFYVERADTERDKGFHTRASDEG